MLRAAAPGVARISALFASRCAAARSSPARGHRALCLPFAACVTARSTAAWSGTSRNRICAAPTCRIASSAPESGGSGLFERSARAPQDLAAAAERDAEDGADQRPVARVERAEMADSRAPRRGARRAAPRRSTTWRSRVGRGDARGKPRRSAAGAGPARDAPARLASPRRVSPGPRFARAGVNAQGPPRARLPPQGPRYGRGGRGGLEGAAGHALSAAIRFSVAGMGGEEIVHALAGQRVDDEQCAPSRDCAPRSSSAARCAAPAIFASAEASAQRIAGRSPRRRGRRNIRASG